jgi:hypothetical protein
MICQNAPGVDLDAQHVSCRFNSIAYAREVFGGEPWTVDSYNQAWRCAKARKIINDQLVIVDDQALFDYLKVPLRTIPVEALGMPTVVDENGVKRIAQATSPLDPLKFWVLERWFWQLGHFVYGSGVNFLKPKWDPIQGGSLTREHGTLMDLRVFAIVH